MNSDRSFKVTRRRLLYMLGLGAIGFGAVQTVVKAEAIFAKQFAAKTHPLELPEMEYDPDLQMMVDPVTRRPLYVRVEMLTTDGDYRPNQAAADSATATPEPSAKPKRPSKALPTVTSGCKKCPKCDDHCG